MLPNQNAIETEVVQSNAVESITRGEIDIAIKTARAYPRQIGPVKQAMMSFATLDEETAASCFYTLPRGGKTIQGPSVRLAEIAVSCYTNLRAGSRIIETVTRGENPHVVVQAVAFDLEKNVSVTIEKRRRIVGKKSKGGQIDEDDINLAANACSAIAFRDAVFKVVPLALIKPVFEAARRVAVGDARTLSDRRAKCFETFAKMGVAKEAILRSREKKSIEDIGLEDIEILIGLHNAIREGEVKIDEAFPPAERKDPAATIPTVPTPTTSTASATTGTPTPPTPPGNAAETMTTCKHCHEQVANISKHECAQMKAAIAGEAQGTQTNDAKEVKTKAPEPPPAPASGEGDEAMASLKFQYEQAGLTEADVLAYCKRNKVAKPEQTSLAQLSSAKISNLNRIFPTVLPEIRKGMEAAGKPAE